MIPMSFSINNFSKGYQSQKNIGVLREVKVEREDHGVWRGFTEQLGVLIPEAPLPCLEHTPPFWTSERWKSMVQNERATLAVNINSLPDQKHSLCFQFNNST